MKTIRTPDDRFADLPGYPFEPHYADVADGEGGHLRIHSVDEGSGAETILCLHGQPTWSYLYRKMIPRFVAAGHRAVAPDLVGFGRSDKPIDREDYSYARHVGWMRSWMEALDLRGLTLVGQDWGGLIGLRLVAEMPERFVRVVIANTGLPDGSGIPEDVAPMMRQLYASLPVVTARELAEKFAESQATGFLHWIKFCAETPELRVGELMELVAHLPKDLMRGYEAPFPDQRYLAGARKFPSLVPVFPDDPAIPANRHAWEVLRRFEKPFLTAFSDGDPVTRGAEFRFQNEVPGARGLAHPVIRGAGHFLQEERGEELADIVNGFIAGTKQR